jgi:hypothetical protein
MKADATWCKCRVYPLTASGVVELRVLNLTER